MSFRLAAAAAVAAIIVVPGSAGAQVLTERNVSVHMALTIAETALSECGTRVSVAVVDGERVGNVPPLSVAGEVRTSRSLLMGEEVEDLHRGVFVEEAPRRHPPRTRAGWWAGSRYVGSLGLAG